MVRGAEPSFVIVALLLLEYLIKAGGFDGGGAIMRFGLRKCHFWSISGSGDRRRRRAQYTASRPICQVKQRWARLVHFRERFFEGAFHFVTFANIVSEVLQ